MNELKIGEVVYQNSEDRVDMTVVWGDDFELTYAYFNGQTRIFEQVKFPIKAVTKVRQLFISAIFYKSTFKARSLF